MEKTNEVYSKSTVQTVVVTDDEVWTSCCDVMTGTFDILEVSAKQNHLEARGNKLIQILIFIPQSLEMMSFV